MISLHPPAVWLLETSLRVSAGIVLLACLRPLLRRLVGNRATACLWLLVAARLLWPWPVESRWSWPVPPSLLTWITPGTPAADSSARVSIGPATTRGPQHATHGPSAIAAPEKSSAFRPDVWNVLWWSGVLLAVARLSRVHYLTRRWATQTLPGEHDTRLAQGFAAIPPALRQGVGLRITDALEGPALVGIRRPQIWMPRPWLERLSAEEIRHVLLHEIGHVQRRDLSAQWLCSLACCLHWFNPLVWLMAWLARTDRELACDAWVLTHGIENSGRDFPVVYGHTLIKIVEQMRVSPPWRRLPVAVAMAAGKRHLTLRVREIGAFRSVSAWRGWATLGFSMATMAVFTVRGAAPTPEPTKNPDHSTPADGPVATTTPTASPRPAEHTQIERGIEIETKWVEFSSRAMAELGASRAQFAGSNNFAEPIIAAFARQQTDANLPADASSLGQVNLPKEFQNFLRRVNEMHGLDLLSAPRVTTRSGQKATVEIVRDFIYPTRFAHHEPGSGKPEKIPTDFTKTPLGLTVEIELTFSSRPDMIDLNILGKSVTLKGWQRIKDGQPVPATESSPHDDPSLIQEVRDGKSRNAEAPPGDVQPVINTRTVQCSATVVSGSTLLLCLPPEDAEHARKSVVVCFITATAVDAPFAVATETPPGTPDDSADAPVSTNAKYPFGIPVEGKPGFIISPFAPDAGYVDVRGFKRGQEVRDPYTGKIFLVP